MQWGLTRLALQAARRTWLHLGGPTPSKIEAKTWKIRCSKMMRFSHRLFSGWDFVSAWFFRCFLEAECQKIATIRFLWNPWKYRLCLNEIDIFKVSEITKMQTNVENASKKSMFFGTSFLEAFWEGFGRVLGGKNLWFPQFLRENFEAKNEWFFWKA